MSTQTLESFTIGDTVRHVRPTLLKDTGEVCGFSLTRVRVKVGKVSGLYWPENLVKVLPAPTQPPAMTPTKTHHIGQIFFDGLRERVDAIRADMREYYPVGSQILTTLQEEEEEKQFRVLKCSHDGYDLEKVATLTVVDKNGDQYLLDWSGYNIRVISRPAPPPPLVLEAAPKPWEAGEGWYLLAKDEPLKPGDGYVHPDHHAAGFIDYVCRPDLFREERGGKETAHMWQWRRRTPAANA